MRINLAVIPLLDAEHEIDSAAAQDFRLDTKVPSSNLEAMKNVGRYFIVWNVLIHDITHAFHLELVVTVSFHETLLEEYFLVKEALRAC